MTQAHIDIERRFSSLDRLYGDGAVDHLAHAHIMVAGIGGVGSWCVEALARSGVGQLTLIDLDHISESNINRQLPALSTTIGQAKITAMQQRIEQINPHCQVQLVDDFVDESNVSTLIAQQPQVFIDCTDELKVKVALVVAAKKQQVPLMVCGAAGGKTNALTMKQGDLVDATHDALLANLRNRLRKQHGFARPNPHAKKAAARRPKMGVQVLWLEEQAIMPTAWQANTTGPQGLSCAGYGSSVTVTAPMGFAAAQWAINQALA